MSKLFVCLCLCLFISALTVKAGLVNEYVGEFGESDEVCTADNFFQYFVSTPTFFDSSKYTQKVPVFFKCCRTNTSCMTIVFDPVNEAFLNDMQNNELFELDHIQKNLENGTIPLTLYDVKESFDICSYFGTDTFTQESTNLAAVGVERAVPYLEKKTANLVTISLKGGKALGLLEAVNPAALVSSVACFADSKKVNTVLAKLGKCSSYLRNIKTHIAVEGYSADLNECNVDVPAELNLYVESGWAAIKGSIDTLGNAATGFFSFFLNLAKEPLSGNHNLDIKESEYDQLRRIRDAIGSRKATFTFSDTAFLVTQQNERITSKAAVSSKALSRLSAIMNDIEKSRPNVIKIAFSNFFFEPNYNFTQADALISEVNVLLSEGRVDYGRYRFNSAISNIQKIETLYDQINNEVERETHLERKIDKVVILIVVLTALTITVIFAVARKKHPQSEL